MRAAIALLVLVVLLGAGIPILLHVTQKGHDVLPFSVVQEYPPDKKIVPGEFTLSIRVCYGSRRCAAFWCSRCSS